MCSSWVITFKRLIVHASSKLISKLVSKCMRMRSPTWICVYEYIVYTHRLIIIIIIEGLSLLQSIPPTTADKQTQAQKRRGSRSRNTSFMVFNLRIAQGMPLSCLQSVMSGGVSYHRTNVVFCVPYSKRICLCYGSVRSHGPVRA